MAKEAHSEEQAFFEALYLRYGKLMYQVAKKYIAEEQGLEDAVQESFARLLPKGALLRELDEKRLKAYVVATVRNTAITHGITDLEEEYLDYGMSYGRFEDGNGTYITWDMFPLQGTGTNIDTEDADYVEETTINGFDGMVVSEDGDLIIMWGDTVTQHIYTVCTNLSREDAMEIIEAATQ